MERLIKKLSMTCTSHLDEEEEQHRQKELQEKIGGKVIKSRSTPALPGLSEKRFWLLELASVIPEVQGVWFDPHRAVQSEGESRVTS